MKKVLIDAHTHTVVPATSEVAGNSVLLHYMPHKRTLGNRRNTVPFFLFVIISFRTGY